MHVSNKKLGAMNIPTLPDDCEVCLQTKQRFHAPVLDHELQEQATKKLDIVCADLMVPPRGEKGVALVGVDRYSRWTEVVYCDNRSATTLITATKRLFLLLGGTPTLRFVLDREGGLYSEDYCKFLIDSNIAFKFVPTAKHNFNGLVERNILALRVMSRSAMLIGYDPEATHGSVVVYNPDTKRLSCAYIQDVRFREKLSWDEYIRTLPVTPVDGGFTKHQQQYLMEYSDDSDDEEEQQLVIPVTPTQPVATSAVSEIFEYNSDETCS